MKTNFKRVVALVVAIFTLGAALCTYALASAVITSVEDVCRIDVTKFKSIRMALANARKDSSSTITMLTDYTEKTGDCTIDGKKKITIDLAGYNLTFDKSDTLTVKDNSSLNFTGNGKLDVSKLVVKDSTARVSTCGIAKVESKGTLTVEGNIYGYLNADKADRVTVNGSVLCDDKNETAVVVDNLSTVYVNGNIIASKGEAVDISMAPVLDKPGGWLYVVGKIETASTKRWIRVNRKDFTHLDTSNYKMENGYKHYQDSNREGGVYIKDPVARIEQRHFLSVDDAIKAVPEGKLSPTTIRIDQNTKFENEYTISNRSIIFLGSEMVFKRDLILIDSNVDFTDLTSGFGFCVNYALHVRGGSCWVNYLKPLAGTALIASKSAKVTITGSVDYNGLAVMTTSDAVGVIASDNAVVNVNGGIEAGVGVEVSGYAKVTVAGTINAPTYINMSSRTKTVADCLPVSNRYGFNTYTDNGSCAVWVGTMPSITNSSDGFFSLHQAIRYSYMDINLQRDIEVSSFSPGDRLKNIYLNGFEMVVNGGLRNALGVGKRDDITFIGPGTLKIIAPYGSGLTISSGKFKTTDVNVEIEAPVGINATGTGNIVFDGCVKAQTFGVFAQSGAKVTIKGNIESGYVGCFIDNADVTLDGTILAVQFAILGSFGAYPTQASYVSPTTKTGYFTYTYRSPYGTVSNLWVKNPATFVPTRDVTPNFNLSTAVGEPLLLSSVITPSDATGQVVTWYVKNNNATDATISGTHLYVSDLFFGADRGRVTVTAFVNNGTVLGGNLTGGGIFIKDFEIDVMSGGAIAQPPVNVVVNGNHDVTVLDSYAGTSGAGSYHRGATVRMDAGMRVDHEFIGWMVISGNVTLIEPNKAMTSFEMQDSDVTLMATWKYTGGQGNQQNNQGNQNQGNQQNNQGNQNQGNQQNNQGNQNQGNQQNNQGNQQNNQGNQQNNPQNNPPNNPPNNPQNNPQNNQQDDDDPTYNQQNDDDDPSNTVVTFVNPFADVNDSNWFYDDVIAACQMGLINGKTDTTFAPYNNLTYAEAAKLAACMHQKYTTGTVTLTNGTGGANWYDTYVAYAKANGIINKDYNWKANATRSGYMEMFANALPDEALEEINLVGDGTISDVPDTHPSAAAIYKLYRAGILTGVNKAHDCRPDSNIQRGEVAAILTRMMTQDARVTFTM